MTEESSKRQRVRDLLDANVHWKEIVSVVGVSRATVFNVKSGKSKLERRKGSGLANRKRTGDFLNDLKARIDNDPTKSMSRLANDMSVHKSTISRAISEDLGMYSYARTVKHLLTEKQRQTRLERSKKLLTWIRHNGSTVKIYSDKKIFTVDQVLNRRNDRYIAISSDDVQGAYRTKHPSQIMVLEVVASDGNTMKPHFFNPGEKVNAAVYVKVLKDVVMPWLHRTYPSGNYVWQQDGAPAHTSKLAQSFCKEYMADFWPKDLWPSSSPDLNPLDFHVWGALQASVSAVPYPSVDALKSAILLGWADMSVDDLKSACSSFRPRLERVIAAGGGHIE